MGLQRKLLYTHPSELHRTLNLGSLSAWNGAGNVSSEVLELIHELVINVAYNDNDITTVEFVEFTNEYGLQEYLAEQEERSK